MQRHLQFLKLGINNHQHGKCCGSRGICIPFLDVSQPSISSTCDGASWISLLYSYSPFAAFGKKINFKDNLKQYIFEVTIIITHFWVLTN